MSTGYQIRDHAALHYLTIQVVDWIDVFTRQAHKDIVLGSLRYCQEHKALQIFGYVIMSNHIHLIANSPREELSNILRDFKKFTAKNIIERFQFNAQRHSRNETYQMWTHENHAIVIYSPQFAREKLDYLHNNPVRADLVRKPEDYIYSSASNYASMESILDVIVMDINWQTYF